MTNSNIGLTYHGPSKLRLGLESIGELSAGSDFGVMWPQNNILPMAYAANCDNRMIRQDGLAWLRRRSPTSIELQNFVELGRRELPARGVRNLNPPSRLEEHARLGHRERRAGEVYLGSRAVL